MGKMHNYKFTSPQLKRKTEHNGTILMGKLIQIFM